MLKKLFLGNTKIDFYNNGSLLLKIFLIEIKPIINRIIIPISIIHTPIDERSLKKTHTINPGKNEDIEANSSPCLKDFIFFLKSLINLVGLNFVDSIEGLLSLFILILSPPS